MSSVRIWRLMISYPEGSTEPGWRPSGWAEQSLPARLRHGLRRTRFRWPRERMFLSASGASRRAGLLRRYGATVDIQPSDPVTWPGDPGSTDGCQKLVTALNAASADELEAAAACLRQAGLAGIARQVITLAFRASDREAAAWQAGYYGPVAAADVTAAAMDEVGGDAFTGGDADWVRQRLASLRGTGQDHRLLVWDTPPALGGMFTGTGTRLPRAAQDWLYSQPDEKTVTVASSPGLVYDQWRHITTGLWVAPGNAATEDLHAETMTAAQARDLAAAKTQQITQ